MSPDPANIAMQDQAQAAADDLAACEQRVAEAREAERKAARRNAILLPVMTEHGFKFAGQAIGWLHAHDPSAFGELAGLLGVTPGVLYEEAA